jgi:hypothetical protein
MLSDAIKNVQQVKESKKKHRNILRDSKSPKRGGNGINLWVLFSSKLLLASM